MFCWHLGGIHLYHHGLAKWSRMFSDFHKCQHQLHYLHARFASHLLNSISVSQSMVLQLGHTCPWLMDHFVFICWWHWRHWRHQPAGHLVHLVLKKNWRIAWTSMHRCLISSFLASTYPERTSSILYIKMEETEDCLSDYSSWDFTNSYGSHTRTFVQWDQPAGNKGTEIIWMDGRGKNSLAHCCKDTTQDMISIFKWRTQCSPSICIKATETCSTLGMQGCIESAFCIKVTIYNWVYSLRNIR